MTEFGRIVAILNEDQVLIEIDDPFTPVATNDAKLVVFAKAESSSLAELGLPAIYAPKGQIKVVMAQSGNYFLAARFKEGGRIEERPLTSLASLFTQTQQVRVGATWSAEISADDALGVVFPSELKVGDLVGEA